MDNIDKNETIMRVDVITQHKQFVSTGAYFFIFVLFSDMAIYIRSVLLVLSIALLTTTTSAAVIQPPLPLPELHPVDACLFVCNSCFYVSILIMPSISIIIVRFQRRFLWTFVNAQ